VISLDCNVLQPVKPLPASKCWPFLAFAASCTAHFFYPPFPCCALAPHFCCTAGKGKRPLDDSDAAAAHERPCLEVLLGMPSRTVSRRSEGHMVQSLEVSGGAPQVLGTQRRAE
jgi:hypothetical protein